jgi:hypothetical protein
MAKVKSFTIHDTRGVPDGAIATFITECEAEHYVTVTIVFIPMPTPRLTVIVTKLDEKDEKDFERPRFVSRSHLPPIPKCTDGVT